MNYKIGNNNIDRVEKQLNKSSIFDSSKNNALFLMPFTSNSILLYHILKQKGVTVSGFCDNNGALSSKIFERTPVYIPDEAFRRDSNAAVILTEIFLYDANEEQLRNLGFYHIAKMVELSFNDNLEEYIPNLHEFSLKFPDFLPSISALVKKITALKSWGLLIDEIKEDYLAPYIYKERDIVNVASDYDSINFLVCVNASSHFCSDIFFKCINSLAGQKHYRFTLALVFISENKKDIEHEMSKSVLSASIRIMVKKPVDNLEMIDFVREQVDCHEKYDLLITIGANDLFTRDTLASMAKTASVNPSAFIFTANEDRVYHEEYISPYYKKDYQDLQLLDTRQLLRNLICVRSDFNGNIFDLHPEDVYIIEEVLYHYRVLDDIVCDNAIKPIAYYLPQFHTIPENDKWWGTGFTEWINVKRGIPMFEGHYQPHVPGELGYYDLIKDKDVQKKQMDLAVKYGIYGFCYYYYWFNGKRLLEKPLDNILNNPELDMPFCICWANENWTRRWDGMENEILIGQSHDEESSSKFIFDILPILKDPRYIRINGKPLLLIYRTDIFTNFHKTLLVWKKICAKYGIIDLHISIVLNPLNYNINQYHCESLTEFPPHRNYGNNLIEKVTGIHVGFKGVVRDYRDYIRRAMNRRISRKLRFRTIMLSFDNTARRLNNAVIYHGSTPEEYKKLLISLVDFTSKQPVEERLIFINAWNEWAEGNHLEPDVMFGDAYLKATREAIVINC